MTAGVKPYKRIVFDFWKTKSMLSNFQKAAEAPLRLKAEPVLLRRFGTGMVGRLVQLYIRFVLVVQR